MQFDENTMRIKDRKLWLSASSDVYLLDGTNWTVFATEDVLLGDNDYSRHLMTAGFASLPQWWSVDRSVQTLTHSFGWRKKSQGGVWTTAWVKDVWWRKLRQHYLDGSVPGVWRRLGGVTCSDSEQFHVYTVPAHHRHTTDHDQVTFFQHFQPSFIIIQMILSAFRTLEIVEGIKQSKLSGSTVHPRSTDAIQLCPVELSSAARMSRWK